MAPDSANVKELFFPKGSQYDAYLEIRAVLQTSKKSITVVDPYVDQSVLQLFASALKIGMSIKVLTAKVPPDFPNEMKAWRAQYKNATLAVRTNREFHDRFVVIDDTACWHIGCSIKDAGNKVFMLSKIEDSENCIALLKQINSSWASSADVP
ncbi:hypothetical protein B0E41_11380 [Hydrogenophaga sp. A37]|nr:hypothetical protein B0E41_11380 [Hydrogenophaga sp. A37]